MARVDFMRDLAIGEERACEFSAGTDTSYNKATINGNTIQFDEGDDVPGATGDQEFPSPVDYLLASLVGCQVSVLEQTLHQAGIDEYNIHAYGQIEQTDQDDVPETVPNHTATRIDHIDVDVTLSVPDRYQTDAEECLNTYNAGCIVGQSLLNGIDYTSNKEIKTDDVS